jgi:hypothetical protein
MPLIKSVALSHGFWHPGQFSHDYHETFGEMLSDTLAQTRGCALHAAEVRRAVEGPASLHRNEESEGTIVWTGCPAAASPPMPFGCNCTRWPTSSATSCAR